LQRVGVIAPATRVAASPGLNDADLPSRGMEPNPAPRSSLSRDTVSRSTAMASTVRREILLFLSFTMPQSP